MFLQQTNEMLLCYNVLPLHDPMERFCEQCKKILRNDIKKKFSRNSRKRPPKMLRLNDRLRELRPYWVKIYIVSIW